MFKQGLLLVNLGSPDGPTKSEVRRYLREFLMDERVLDVNPITRWLLVNFGIIPRRVGQSTRAYSSIWTSKGSPLVSAGRSVAEKLEASTGMPVALAMRHGKPSVSLALRRLYRAGVRELTVLPLFPQYARSSYGSVVEHVEQEMKTLVPGMEYRVIPPFFEEPAYLDALAASAAPFLSHQFDHVLLSFHGLPERHLTKSDPTGSHCLGSEHCCELISPARRTCYRAQCLATSRALMTRLKIPADKWSVSFQSRLAGETWMRPYTEQTLVALGTRGIEHLYVICPSFVADCLETLEEIAIRGKETFHSAGGGELTLIPCLNDHPAWIKALTTIVSRRPSEAETLHAH